MRGKCSLVLCAVTACSSPPGPQVDPCEITDVVAHGSVQLGLGVDDTPLADGQDVALVCGTQGGTMFLLNARVQDLDMTADLQAAITFTATGPSGADLTSASGGCRTRTFEPAGDGTMKLTGAYGLPLDPSALTQYPLDGARVKITVEVHDHLGRGTSDMRTVVARLPPSC
jgi:hypothetical protein